ncbi:MAG: M3 family metallopeptidase [Gammaproteobacteria bacterium]|nr:M3 family metallopeptidase [Gammaproteobacteria bacterium]
MQQADLPLFESIQIDTFPARLEALLAQHLQKVAQLTQETTPTWETLMRPLEEMQNELEKFWSPLSHLHAVANTPALRTCYEACLPKLSAYESALGQNQALYDAVKRINTASLNAAQQTILADQLRDFVLAGVALSDEHKKRFEEISSRLSHLANQFENHVLDAVHDFHHHVTDLQILAGLPPHAVAKAEALAKEKTLEGWAIGLDAPTVVAVLTYADDRKLRETIYEAYVTRASDQGPSAGRFDNTLVMQEILSLRLEAAQLLDFPNYAALSVATKMAKSPQEVMTFLQDLIPQAHQQAKSEFTELQIWARETLQMGTLEPWDVSYVSEKKKEALFAISQEALRAYFPLPKVLSGLFAIIEQLYGMRFEEVADIDRWHPDVICYCLVDETDAVRGYIYMDLFARAHKRGGAWMDSCQSRFVGADGSIQLPIATLTCNFAKSDGVAHLSHDELETLFHEMGHCLHHVLTKVDYISGSGIHGVEWDAVELPSQFFENWCWEALPIEMLTAHMETGASLPADMFQQLMAAKNFQSAMALIRQLEFSLFDFRIHETFSEASDTQWIGDVLKDIRQKIAVTPTVSYGRFQHSFSHIFAGGYAAGYYSYIWAEVLSSDAFGRFEEDGIFDTKAGRDFLHQILEVGGSKKAADAFVAFRGRMPTVDALLRHRGINS